MNFIEIRWHIIIILSWLRHSNSLQLDLGPKRSLPHNVACFASMSEETEKQGEQIKAKLLGLIATTPSNLPTSKISTSQILNVIREMEDNFPAPEEEVFEKLGGNWELLWTAQDQSSDEWGLGPLRTWIK